MRGRNSALAIVDRPVRNERENRGERAFQILHGIGPRVEGREGVHEHDLPIEARKVLPVERPHHHVLVRLVAPLHHCMQRSGGGGRGAG